MITTAIYRLDTSDTQWDVSHLFEHAVLRGFYEHVKQLGYHPGLIGWLSADTFEKCIYIDAGFYDPAVARHFAEYLTSHPTFSEADIALNLENIEVEEKAIATITSHEELIRTIHTLSERTWNNSVQVDQKVQTIISLRKRASRFRNVTIGLYADDLSDTEKKLFLRFYVILIDLLRYDLRSTYQCYSRGNGLIRQDDEGLMGFIMQFTFVRDGIRRDKIADRVRHAMEVFDIAGNMEAIDRHFEAFSSEPLWASFPVEYYRDAGIVTTVEEVAQTATAENIKSLLSKLQVLVRPSTELDSQVIS